MELQRRDFLKLIGTSAAAATITGCSQQKPQALIPYVIPDEEIVPGRSVWYATVCRECPASCGMHVRVREGRATKAEGNPRHPVNRGALCARGQASLQGLYNPDRIQHPLRKSGDGKWETLSWELAEEYLVQELRKISAAGRASDVVWLGGYVNGSLRTLIDEWLRSVGTERQFQLETLSAEPLVEAGKLAFGMPAVPWFAFDRADVILSLGADFLETFLSPVGFMMDFASRRGDAVERNYMVYAGPRLSLTASNADLWLPVQASALTDVALSVAYLIMEEGAGVAVPDSIRSAVARYTPARVAERTGVPAETLAAVARRFAQAKGRGIAITGFPHCSGPNGIALASATLLLNALGGNAGRTVQYGRGHAIGQLTPHREIADTIARMRQGKVPALFVADANPAFALPARMNFAEAAGHVPLIVSFASMMDETAEMATLVLPVHHPLESWGDDQSYAGIHALMQPVMQPLFQTRMLGDILLGLARKRDGKGLGAESFEAYVQQQWSTLHRRLEPAVSFTQFWRSALEQGGIWEANPAEPPLTLRTSVVTGFTSAPAGAAADGKMRLTIFPSVALYDGRGANKPWLQELPDPIARAVWGGWLEIHPEDAAERGISEGDAVTVSSADGSVELPAVLVPSLRRGELAVPLGQGHTAYGRFAKGKGINPGTLLSTPAAGGIQWSGIPVSVERSGRRLPLVLMQEARSQHGRELFQRQVPGKAEGREKLLEHAREFSLYEEPEHRGHRWAMVIDLDTCTGCGSCVTACYAENNVPVVGPEEVRRGRELAWLRIDRYFNGDSSGVRAEFMPMLCQHCGRAPCEPVCPVYAAYHTVEGLNGQVYNRCIGTRYCANNCPYKVRRFNWFAYDWPEPLNWQLNPDVTVRSPGVMEKCTFCIQRIMEARQNARAGNRPIRDGEVMTACQQTCPARAISFGDQNDPGSAVAQRLQEHERGYRVLEELNTVPSIVYKRERS